MAASLRIGKKSVNPRRARDSKGARGIFLTDKEWTAILSELKVKTEATKKESPFKGTLAALEEVELYLHGKKKLRNAKLTISEL